MDKNAGSQGSFAITPKMVIGLVIAVIALAFILQNRDEVVINLLVFRFGAPLWLALLGIFVLGVAAGWLVKRSRK